MSGKIIRQKRIDKGLSVLELSKKAAISRSYISEIENDKKKPSKDILKKIAAALDLSVVELTNSHDDNEYDEQYDKNKMTKEHYNNTVITPQLQHEDKVSLILKEDMQSKLFNLLEHYEDLEKIINHFKTNADKMTHSHKEITIELPIASEDARTTVRMNPIIWNQFKNFCIQHKPFKEKDLLSMALKEYMENHK